VNNNLPLSDYLTRTTFLMRKNSLKFLLCRFFLFSTFVLVAQAQTATDETQNTSRENAVSALKKLNQFFDLSNEQNKNTTTLAFTNASWDGKIDVLGYYIQAGIDINAQNVEFRNTALYAAAENRKWSAVEYLLAQGANPNISNVRGRTPLLSVLEHGAKIKTAYEGKPKDLLLALLAKNAYLNARDIKTNATPLTAVAERNDAEIMAAFIAKGADTNTKDTEGRSLLYIAVVNCSPGVTKALAEKGADVNFLYTRPVPEGGSITDTALIRATDDCYSDVISPLLENGANVNTKDSNGETALTKAVLDNDPESVKLLLSYKADVRVINKDGKNLVSLANSDVKKLLIEKGAPLTFTQRFAYYTPSFTLAQLILMPVVFVVLYFASSRAKKNIVVPPKRNATAKGDDLPHLAPLKCDSCGAGVPLKVDSEECPSCHSHFQIPKDYVKTIKLRTEATEKLKEAISAWRRARIYTSFPVRITFWFIALFYLSATLFGFYGLITFSGSGWKILGGIFGTLNGISLACAIGAYAVFIGGNNKRLPVIGKKIGNGEKTNCHLCGGAIEYHAGDLVTACGYCGCETYRVALTRKASLIATKEKEDVEVSIYDSMCEISKRREEMLEYAGVSVIVVYYVTIKIIFEVLNSK